MSQQQLFRAYTYHLRPDRHSVDLIWVEKFYRAIYNGGLSPRKQVDKLNELEGREVYSSYAPKEKPWPFVQKKGVVHFGRPSNEQSGAVKT